VGSIAAAHPPASNGTPRDPGLAEKTDCHRHGIPRSWIADKVPDRQYPARIQPGGLAPPAECPMPAPMLTLPRLFAIVLLLPILAGCGPRTNEFPPPCPNPAFLRDLSDLVRYRPGAAGRDLTDLVVRARLTALRGRCEQSSPNTLDTLVEVNMELFRGPAMQGRRVQIPIFLAVLDGDAIVNKQVFPVDFEFPDNLDRATISTPPVALGLPVSPQKSGAAYGLIAGFQLTDDELATNRRRGF